MEGFIVSHALDLQDLIRCCTTTPLLYSLSVLFGACSLACMLCCAVFLVIFCSLVQAVGQLYCLVLRALFECAYMLMMAILLLQCRGLDVDGDAAAVVGALDWDTTLLFLCSYAAQ